MSGLVSVGLGLSVGDEVVRGEFGIGAEGEAASSGKGERGVVSI